MQEPSKTNQELLEEISALQLRIKELEHSDAQRKIEHDYQTLFREMLEGFALHEIICDTQGQPMDYRFLTVNPAFERITGLKAEQIIGRTVLEVLPATERHWIETYGRVALTGEPSFFESYTQTLDKYFVVTAFQPVPKQFACIFVDITDRKRAEKALQESEERFRVTQELSPDGFTILRPVRDSGGRVIDFTWVYENTAIARMNGTDPSSIVGMRLLDLFPGHRGTAILDTYQEVAESGESRIMEAQYQGESMPTPTWFRLVVVSMGSDIAILAQNITERKLAEEIIQVSETKYRNLHQSMMDAFVSVDMDGRIKDYNEPYLRMLGYKPEEISRLTYRDFTPEKWHAMEAAIVERQVITRGYSDVYEKEYQRKDGTIFPVELRTSLLRDNAGTPVSMWAIVRDITERKQAEVTLRQSSYRLELAQTAAKAGIWDWDIGTGHIEWTDEMFDLFGLDQTKVRASFEAWRGIIHPEDIDIVGRRIDQALMEKKDLNSDYRVVLSDGQVRWINAVGRAEYDDQGRPCRMTGICIDITERKQAEKVLRETNETLRTLVQSSPLAIIALDPDGNVTRWNTAAEHMFGWLESEVLGHFLPIVSEDKRNENLKLRERVLRGEAFTNVEVQRRKKDGSPIDISISTAPLRDSQGRITGIMSVSADITDSKRAAEALLESEERYRNFVEESFAGVYVVQNGRFVFLNDNSASFSNYKREELIGKNSYSIIHPDDIGKVKDNSKRMLKGEVTSPYEFRILTKDGQIRWIMETVKSIQYAGGRAVLGNSMNITERKHAEEEKLKLEAQLIQAQKMESVGRLAGGVAHDFNNMLGVILGHTEMALDHMASSDPLHADLKEIQIAAKRSADLTRQLLAFARKQVVSPKVVDMNDTVAGMLKMLQRLIGEDIDLAWLPGFNLWPVKIDPSQIDQILANLCVNARDAIAGVGKITIETGNIKFDAAYCADNAGYVPGEYILLAVSDDGCGMGKEILDKLYEPFFTTKKAGKGTGLGLATVFGIVKQNDGFINVYSEPDRGTTFKIYLPRHIGKSKYTQETEGQEPVMRGKETVLIVEDEPAILNLSKRMLEKQGYQVLTAATPGAAIGLAEEYPGEIHLLMTDVVMPEMNGRDLAKKLLPINPNMKCLFMSGYTANVIAHHGVLDEGVHFIQKPFSRKDIASKVREALD